MNSTLKITVKVTSQYGNEAIYPACKASQIFALIAGTKTLTRATLTAIKALGYSIEVVGPELPKL